MLNILVFKKQVIRSGKDAGVPQGRGGLHGVCSLSCSGVSVNAFVGAPVASLCPFSAHEKLFCGRKTGHYSFPVPLKGRNVSESCEGRLPVGVKVHCLKANVFPRALTILGTPASMTPVSPSVAYLIIFCASHAGLLEILGVGAGP